MIDKETYVSNFQRYESSVAATAPSWVRDIRKTGIDSFQALGFPTNKDEEWRFTRVRPLLQHDFELPLEPSHNGFAAEQLGRLSFPDSGCHRLVFVNGHFAENLSPLGELPKGVEIINLKSAFEKHGDLVRRHLAKHAEPAKNPFVALNTAYLFDGAFLRVAKGVSAERPIHILYVTTTGGSESMAQPRNLILLEENSRATIVESYVGTDDGVYFTNAVTEIVVGENARADHCKIQKESRSAYHIASLGAHMGGNSRLTTKNISLGGTLVRNDVVTVLDGEGIDCTLDGLYMADGHQHVDNHTSIEHAKPHCESHELYKGLLGGRAKGVFNGKIHVHPDAQKTDAKQSNACMLLSEDAQINTNPQLEIYADDVKCTHGAAVGQIDEKAVFYLRSRGIDEIDARHMLIYAFANEVLERVRVAPLRDRLASDLVDWLSNAQKS